MAVVSLVTVLQVVALLSPKWAVIKGEGNEVDINPFGATVDGNKLEFPLAEDTKFPSNALIAVKVLSVLSVASLLAALYLHSKPMGAKHGHRLVMLSLLLTLVTVSVWVGSIQTHITHNSSGKVDFGYSYWLLVSSLILGVVYCVACHLKHMRDERLGLMLSRN